MPPRQFLPSKLGVGLLRSVVYGFATVASRGRPKFRGCGAGQFFLVAAAGEPGVHFRAPIWRPFYHLMGATVLQKADGILAAT